MNVACVPLPAPGAPNKISLMNLLAFDGPRRRRWGPVLHRFPRRFVGDKNSTRQRGFGPRGGTLASQSSVAEQAAHPLQILRRIDAGAGGMRRDMHSDPVAMPECAQLLQRLGVFNGRGRKLGESAQEAGAIAVDTDMLQRRQRWQPRDALRGTVAPPRNRG